MVGKFSYRAVDLTHQVAKNSPCWEGGCGFEHTIGLDYDDCDTAVKFCVQQIKMDAGIGTHIDAPAHCFKEAKTVEAIPLDDLIAPLVCIDVSSQIFPDFKLSRDNILNFEKKYGVIPSHCFVIIHTGWSQYWNHPEKYRNQHRFPSIADSAAELLLKRDVVGIGVDTLSPDVPSSGFPVHRLILGAGKYIVENVANAEKMPAIGSYVLTMPMNFKGLTESPVRMLGLVVK